MGPGDFVFLIPITAIVLGIGSGIVKSVLSSQERRLEMRLNAQQGQSDSVLREIQSLRTEVASLRDTSTEYDMSLDNALRRLSERMDHVEARTVGYGGIPTPAPEAAQTVGRSTSA